MSDKKDRRKKTEVKSTEPGGDIDTNNPFAKNLISKIQGHGEGSNDPQSEAGTQQPSGNSKPFDIGEITKYDDGVDYDPLAESNGKPFGSSVRPNPGEGDEEIDEAFRRAEEERLSKGEEAEIPSENEDQEEGGGVQEEDTDTDTPEGDKDSEDKYEGEVNFKEYLANPHNPEKTKKSIRRLLGEINQLKAEKEKLQSSGEDVSAVTKERDDLKSELEKLREQALSDKDHEELIKLRRLVDVKNDPEISGKYKGRVEQSRSAILEILRKNGLSEKSEEVEEKDQYGEPTGKKVRTISIESIEAAGGIDSWIEKYPASYRTLINAIDKDSPRDVDLIRAAVVEIDRANREYDQEVKEASENAKEWWETQKSKSKSSEQELLKAQEEERKIALEWKQKIVSEAKVLQPLEIPKDATDKQKKELEEENLFRSELAAGLEDFLYPASLAERKQLALAATGYMLQKRNLDKLEEENKAKDAEIAKLKKMLKGGGGTRVRSDSTPLPSSSGKPLSMKERLEKRQMEKIKGR